MHPETKAFKDSIKIEKGIPLAVRKGSTELKNMLPLERMEVGDSFFIAITGDDEDVKSKLRNNVRSFVKRHQKDFSTKFRTRTVIENKITGLRVWRTE